MITVKIELNSAITGKTTEIGRMYIANDGTGTAERGDYKVAVCRRGTTAQPREFIGGFIAPERLREFPKAMRTAEVKDYPRLAHNVWRLVARAVLASFPEETTKRAKTTDKPIIDGAVMRGLAKIMHDQLGTLAERVPAGTPVEQVLSPDEIAAVEWISAAVVGPDGEP